MDERADERTDRHNGKTAPADVIQCRRDELGRDTSVLELGLHLRVNECDPTGLRPVEDEAEQPFPGPCFIAVLRRVVLDSELVDHSHPR